MGLQELQTSITDVLFVSRRAIPGQPGLRLLWVSMPLQSGQGSCVLVVSVGWQGVGEALKLEGGVAAGFRV